MCNWAGKSVDGWRPAPSGWKSLIPYSEYRHVSANSRPQVHAVELRKCPNQGILEPEIAITSRSLAVKKVLGLLAIGGIIAAVVAAWKNNWCGCCSKFGCSTDDDDLEVVEVIETVETVKAADVTDLTDK